MIIKDWKEVLVVAVLAVLIFIFGLLNGCAVVKQAARFTGAGFKLVSVAADGTANAISYAAESISEPNE